MAVSSAMNKRYFWAIFNFWEEQLCLPSNCSNSLSPQEVADALVAEGKSRDPHNDYNPSPGGIDVYRGFMAFQLIVVESFPQIELISWWQEKKCQVKFSKVRHLGTVNPGTKLHVSAPGG